jgi:hypothetical protein
VREHTLLQVEQYRIRWEEERDQYTRSRYSILTAQQWEEVREHTLLQVEQYRIRREEQRGQYTVRKMDLILRSIQRRPQIQFSVARKFTLQHHADMT